MVAEAKECARIETARYRPVCRNFNAYNGPCDFELSRHLWSTHPNTAAIKRCCYCVLTSFAVVQTM